MKYSILVMVVSFVLLAQLFVPSIISAADDANRKSESMEESRRRRDEMVWQGRTFLDRAYKDVYGFHGKVWPLRRNDFTIHKLDYLQLPDNVPQVAKVLDLVNMAIDTYNDAIPNDRTPYKSFSTSSLADEWNQARTRLKRKYDNSSEVYEWIIKVVYQTREDQNLSMLLADTYVGINYIVPKDTTLLLPGVRIMLDDTGKVKFIFCFYPPTSEEHVYVYRVTEAGSQFITFTLEDENAQPVPWILWDKEGNIIEQSTRLMYLKDYDIPFDLDEIRLRNSTPHEFWIPDESLRLTGR